MTFPVFVKWVLWAIVGYGIVALLVYLFHAHLIYFPNVPTRTVATTPTQVRLAFETVTITTQDGVTLEGWYLPSSQQKGTLLFFHGNAGNIGHRLDSLQLFHALGLSTFIIDYRGYGRSEGRPTETGTYLDAQAAWRHLTIERQIPPAQIIVFGRSLGGAIAAHLAARTEPGALIVESTFTSVPDLAAKLYPFLPVRRLTRFQYATKDSLKAVTCPVLIIHSRDDEIIPFAQGQTLYQAANPPKQLLVLSGGHNEAFLIHQQKYLEGINTFLKAYFDP